VARTLPPLGAFAAPLLGACAAVELLAMSGVLPARMDLVHAVALPPFDLTFDLGTLLGRATNPVWFSVGLLLAIAGRATILAGMLGSVRRRWWFAVRFELVVLVPAFVAAELAYAGQAVLYSALFWVGALVAVASAIVFSHVPWRVAGRPPSSIRSGLSGSLRLPTVVLYLVGLGTLSAAVRNGGEISALVALPVSACITLVAARRLSLPASAPLAARAAVVVVAAAVLGLVLGATAPNAPNAARRPGELVVVAGIDTSSGHGSLFEMRPSSLGFSCSRTVYYSYAGPGRGAARGEAACPISEGARYTRADTERPLAQLVRSFRAQVDRLVAPVTVVTHSSGAWVAWAAVSGDNATPVRRILMLAPLTDPVGYARPGADGTGAVGAAGMRAVMRYARWIGFSRFDPDRPLAVELLGSPRAVTALFGRHLPPGVHTLAVPSAYDLALFETSEPFPLAQTSCPVPKSHGALPTSVAAADDANFFLSGEPAAPCDPWAGWLSAAATGFQVH